MLHKSASAFLLLQSCWQLEVITSWCRRGSFLADFQKTGWISSGQSGNFSPDGFIVVVVAHSFSDLRVLKIKLVWQFLSLPTAEGKPRAIAFRSDWTYTLVHAVNYNELDECLTLCFCCCFVLFFAVCVLSNDTRTKCSCVCACV